MDFAPHLYHVNAMSGIELMILLTWLGTVCPCQNNPLNVNKKNVWLGQCMEWMKMKVNFWWLRKSLKRWPCFAASPTPVCRWGNWFIGMHSQLLVHFAGIGTHHGECRDICIGSFPNALPHFRNIKCGSRHFRLLDTWPSWFWWFDPLLDFKCTHV
jgi:hypothetical protein